MDRQRIGYSELQRGVPFSSVRMTKERIKELDKIGFVWNLREETKKKRLEERRQKDEVGDSGPTSEDWSSLFESMKEKGIDPSVAPKPSWVDGVDELSPDDLGDLTDDDIMDLWNDEDDDDEW
eukprot:13269736-Ditylum_brightwellii.AAC.1